MSMGSTKAATQPNDTESRGSMAPLLPGSFPQGTESSQSSSYEPETTQLPESATDPTADSGKPSKRPFWKLGKKTDEDKAKEKGKTSSLSKSTATPHIAPVGVLRSASPLRSPEPSRGSVSSQRGQPYGSPGSPAHAVYSSSPRLHSPASSQIFERNVQEDVVPPQASPQIPSHIITENHIPPALDASSAAITNERLDPDSVEIVTHAMHLPAVIPVGPSLEASLTSFGEDHGLHRPETAGDDTASNYGTLDNADVRRLSFISFADVVHAEHAEHAEPGAVDHHTGRNSVHLGNPSGIVPTLAAPPRSPSPVHSPLSSPGHGTSPPSSVSPSFKGLDTSPAKGHRGSGSSMPSSAQSPLLSGAGELNIETMRQALRKTGSGDLSGIRSQPLSAVGNDDGTFADRPFK
ncbi:hypothetical protein EPUS_07414 [Endocarpon pusillum Z07020]|uniref:Uncharacterized protein n=1 Tax=Endocarpon pusillum (strain Z07020 / HMAS-L-300199) TaxID=1263415 RepID=U1GHU6_ENDPU|nr:uncharacterized protein EPUS_07414 [Endocarpon pusillum Z07020]ERF71386.1 hypothetical protein EPUS_07414 [Endocarpon pusillum Z07020]